MIVSYDEAILVYEKIDSKYRSFYYHPEYVMADAQEKNLKAIFFCIEEEGEIFYHAFHIGNTPIEGMYDIQSPYGYGGPVVQGSQQFCEASYVKYIEWCKRNNILVEFIRFYPVIKNNEYYPGNLLFNRDTVVMDLSVDNLLMSYSTRVRTAIRNAQKSGVTISDEKSIGKMKDFYNVYTQLMNEKKTSEEYFFSMEYFVQIINSSKTELFTAYSEEGDYLGGAIFFHETQLAEYHLSAATNKGKKLNISHLLIHSFAEYAKEKGVNFFYLGGGNNKEDSLLFFKKGFSKALVDFNIGYTVFDSIAYQKLKQLQEGRGDRILFYRYI